MIERGAFDDMYYCGKPVAELDRDELMDLCRALHWTVWNSMENFERLLEVHQAIMRTTFAGRA